MPGVYSYKDMIKFSKQVVTWALGIISAVFTLVPEALFGCYKIVPGAPCEVNIIINRVLCFLAITVLSEWYMLWTRSRILVIRPEDITILSEGGTRIAIWI